MNEQSIHDIDFGLYSADDTKENSIELLYYLFSAFFIQITKNGISSTSLQKYLSFYFQYPNYNSSLQCNFYWKLYKIIDCLSSILLTKPTSTWFSLSFFGGEGLAIETSRQTESHS